MLVVVEALGINKVGGPRTGILNTIMALPIVMPDARIIVYLSQLESYLTDTPQIEQRIIAPLNRFADRIRLQKVLPQVTRREKVDLVHFTKNLMTWFVACPTVVTIHDLTVLRYPGTQSWIDFVYWRLIQPMHLWQADRVIAVSLDAARDLVELYGMPQERIHVIPWATDNQYRQRVRSGDLKRVQTEYRLPKDYVLFLGSLAKKKNLSTLLRSMVCLRRRGSSYHLVIAGRNYPQSDASGDLSLIHDLGLDEIVHYIGPVPDEDLPALYASAGVYVLPSLHEGFGIPCWEAMAVGVPVVASNRGALPEVIGNAGLLINNPLEADEWADAIFKVTSDEVLRNKLVNYGYRQIGSRTWRDVAAETVNVYSLSCGLPLVGTHEKATISE